MKGYPQPLSEAFVYGSPERLVPGSFRWMKRAKARSKGRDNPRLEVPRADKQQH